MKESIVLVESRASVISHDCVVRSKILTGGRGVETPRKANWSLVGPSQKSVSSRAHTSLALRGHHLVDFGNILAHIAQIAFPAKKNRPVTHSLLDEPTRAVNRVETRPYLVTEEWHRERKSGSGRQTIPCTGGTIFLAGSESFYCINSTTATIQGRIESTSFL